jgi:D-alanine--poly(phosphoribitol) ligase subunit 1
MLNKILFNLENYPEDECYQIKDKIYKNKDLYKYVCNIYNYLIKNCNYQDKVIVYGHKEIYMVASFLACSFAGMTYIPIDISIPEERKYKIINQVKPTVIIDNKIEQIMDNNTYKSITEIRLNNNDIYYIIFTSGSTGKPKGVQITYGNLQSCMKWLIKICNINKDIVLNQANYSFDLSVADLYLPLLTRSKHYILERETQKDFAKLFNELNNSNAGIAVMTPSFADLLMVDSSFNNKLMPNIKKILFCGERLTSNTVNKLNERFDNLQIINSYGPTECTFAVTSNIVKQNEEISVGTPKDDVEIFIVNEKLEKLNEEEIGEILISGESVGLGYLNTNLNKNVFITFNNKQAYLTGDLGYIKNNKLYCIGRKDKQIKFKGYRIELLEIENVINNIDYVDKTVVTVTKQDDIVKRIIAFVKLNDNNHTIQDIKKLIEKELPNYMIPTIKIVDEIPLTENGKVNEKALLGELQ